MSGVGGYGFDPTLFVLSSISFWMACGLHAQALASWGQPARGVRCCTQSVRYQWCLKYCTAFSCCCAARRVQKRSKIPAFSGLRILFARIQTKFTGFHFSNHGNPLSSRGAGLNCSCAECGLLSWRSCDAPTRCASWQRSALAVKALYAKPQRDLLFSMLGWSRGTASPRACDGDGSVPWHNRDSACWVVRADALPLPGACNFTPARRALERPIAMACLVDAAPCLPSRTWCISSRTNSPACVLGDFPSRASSRARSSVSFSGISPPFCMLLRLSALEGIEEFL